MLWNSNWLLGKTKKISPYHDETPNLTKNSATSSDYPNTDQPMPIDTAYGNSHDLWTSVIPDYCTILKSVIIGFLKILLKADTILNQYKIVCENNVTEYDKDSGYFI